MKNDPPLLTAADMADYQKIVFSLQCCGGRSGKLIDNYKIHNLQHQGVLS